MAKQPQLDKNGFRKFGMLDKVSYAAGDFGCNMSFALAGTYFTLFWTQYMKIDSLVFAGLLIVLKVWDAINDPLIGSMMDSSTKQYKLGKFKHFIAIGAVGLMVAAALCFLPVQGAPMIAKYIICMLGYVAWDACYTVVNVPYGSMLSVISADAGDRAQLGAWRTLGSLAASLPTGMILPVLLYDENNDIMGGRLFIAALVMGVIGLIAFRFMIKTTVERVQIAPKTEESPKFNFFESIKDFMHNRAALGATIFPLGMLLGTAGAATATQVMFQAYFKNAQISGAMGLITLIPMILFIPFTRKITEKWGKKEGASFGLIFSMIACALMLIIPIPANGTGIAIYMLLQLMNGLGQGVAMCVGNAMMADAIDYHEWKTGKREDGMTYALHSFFRKLVQGIGPSICLVLMVMLGYDEALGAAQPDAVAANMRYLVAGIYFVGSIIMFVGTKFIYNLDKKTLEQMQKELGRG